MARPQVIQVCQACQGETAKWQGQCPHCGEWNSLVARSVSAAPRGRGGGRGAPLVSPEAAVDLPGVLARASASAGPARLALGISELDRVLGGGLVPGSVTLIGGEPGIGKSTLLLQVASAVASAGVLYVSGEESADQIALRAARLGGDFAGVRLLPETDLPTVLAQAETVLPRLLIVDSIQTMQQAEVTGAAGSVSQLRECTAALVRHAKSTGTSVLIVGHVTKDGAIAGPRMLEHLVDTVLYFERDAGSRFRRVRAAKNRFGAANELGFFLMQESGLREVRNPAAIYLSRSPHPVVGSLVMVTRDGTRPLLVEVQGLTDASRLSSPRRVAQGLDAGRLAMVLAVLSRHGGVALQEHDVFANVVGGLVIDEPAWDVPVALALASSLRGIPLPADLVAFGELGLTGEVRPVPYGEERIREAARQGFRRALVPMENLPRVRAADGAPEIAVTGVATIAEALAHLSGDGRAAAPGSRSRAPV